MNDFAKNLTTPYWWLSVIVVSMVVNIFSAYLKSWLDQIKSSFSNRAKIKNEMKKEAWLKKVEHLKQNPSERYFVALEDLRYRINILTFILMALFGAVLASYAHTLGKDKAPIYIGFSIGLVFIILAMIEMSSAMKTYSLLNSSKKS